VSLTTISTFLRNCKITLKRTNLVLERVNDLERLEMRRIFALDFLTNADLNDANNVFIDECGFNLHLRRNYGRSLRGNRVCIEVPTIRGRNVTLLSAINGNCVLHFKIFQGSCRGEIFSEFLRELDQILVHRLNLNNCVVFMDNCSAHRSMVSRETIAQMTCETKFISPHSYMLNPIEYSFGKIKTIVRNNLGESNLNLNEMITTAISQINADDCCGWFRLIRRNCALAMQNHQFK
jgi:transposase